MNYDFWQNVWILSEFQFLEMSEFRWNFKNLWVCHRYILVKSSEYGLWIMPQSYLPDFHKQLFDLTLAHLRLGRYKIIKVCSSTVFICRSAQLNKIWLLPAKTAMWSSLLFLTGGNLRRILWITWRHFWFWHYVILTLWIMTSELWHDTETSVCWQDYSMNSPL